MATVRFTQVDEFVAELRRDAASIERRLVRLTFRHRWVDPAPFRAMAVVASFVAAGHVVALEERIGTYLPNTSEAQAVQSAAEKQYAVIQRAAEELGLELRAGVFEEAIRD